MDELAASQLTQTALMAKVEALEQRLTTEAVSPDELGRALDQAFNQAHDNLLANLPADERVDQLGNELAALRDEIERTSNVRPEAMGSPSPEQIRREIELGLEDLTRQLEQRVAASAGTGLPDAAAVDAETERSLMAIERLGLRLGEHDRALAELMGTRGVTRRLDDLAAQLEDLAASGPAVGDASEGRSSAGASAEVRSLARRMDEAEQSSRADREKLLDRLERMAAKLDWRLHRLETGGSE